MAPLPLAPELMARWGISYDGVTGLLRLAPEVVVGEPQVIAPPFRAGRTIVGLELRQRADGVRLRIAIRFGPPVRVEVGLPGGPSGEGVLVDDVALAGPTVAFEARGEHEVVWLDRPGRGRPGANVGDGPIAGSSR